MLEISHIEKSSAAEIQLFQANLLRKQLYYLKDRSAFYAQMLGRHQVDIDAVQSIADLAHLPCTTKEDLQQHNEAFLCVDRKEIVDYVTTSGTAGDPVLFALTDNDLERLAANEAASYGCAGLRAGDVIQLTTTMDRRFMAGLAYFMGARKAGIGMVRVGSGVPELQWDTVSRVRPTAIICVPSFLLKMIEYAEANQIDYRASSLRKAICIGEPLRDANFQLNTLAKRIREKWDIELFSTYASTEMSTAFTECAHGRGGHVNPNLIITEFLDDQNRPVAVGEPGELVVTTLGVEGMPLLRFKTGDIVQASEDVCACGRTTQRIGPVIGRKNQMIKYKGTTIYPPAMFDLLNDFEAVENYVVEIATNELDEDEINVRIGVQQVDAELLNRIKDRFRAKIRVSPNIVFDTVDAVNRLKFPENARKSVLFYDFRKVDRL